MADGWERGDVAKVAACFADDVRYGDPLRYRFERRADLLPFFEPGPEGQHCTWHRFVFDEERQAGAAEYTYVGARQYHGAVMIELRDGMVATWREWQHVTDVAWEMFVEGPADQTP